MIDDPINQRMAFANQLVHQAGTIAIASFRRPLSIAAIKQHDSKLQICCELEIESFLHTALRTEFPDDGWWGEETGKQPGTSAYTWLVDPIDGTTAFTMGKPTFTTTIALQHHTTTIGGIIYQPISKELITATLGKGCFCNGSPVRLHITSTHLPHARICTNPPYMFKTLVQKNILLHIYDHTCAIEYGGDAYNYLLMATGYIDAIIACAEDPYDFAMAQPIVQEAGGILTDWQGRAITAGEQPSNILASTNPVLHNELVQCIKHLSASQVPEKVTL